MQRLVHDRTQLKAEFAQERARRGGQTLRSGLNVLVLLLLSLGFVGCGDGEATPEKLPEEPVVQPVESPDSPPPRPINETSVREFQKEARRAVSSLGGKVQTSAMVVDVATGEVLFSHQAKKTLVPASNMKVLVGAASMVTLGLDHKLETRFAIDGRYEDGVLAGNLVAIGCGDPTISARFFDGDPKLAMKVLASSFVAQGLKRIEGRILADSRAFSGPASGPNWPKDNPWLRYMVQVSPLVFNDNQVEISAKNKGGRETVVSVYPETDYVSVANRMKTTMNKDAHVISVDRGRRNNQFVLRGRIKSGASSRVGSFNVHNGSLYFVHALREALIEEGVVVEGGIGEVDADLDVSGMDDLLVYTSRLEQVLAPMLKNSQNLYAELVLRMLGRSIQGEGSFAAGLSVLRDFLDEVGVLEEDNTFADGSGLSRDNKVNAAQFAKLLAWVAQDKERGAAFRRLLAEPKRAGTLRKRMHKLAGRVFAKTGTMTNISSLAGYVRIGKDRLVAFAMINNNGPTYRSRRAQDALCEAIAGLSL